MVTLVRRTSLAAVAGCLALLVTACGGDDPKTEAGAEDTVGDYVEGFVDGDGDVCDLLTDDYADQLVDDWNEGGFGEDEEAEDCDDVVEAGAAFAEAFDSDELEISDFDTEIDGDEATVAVDYDGDEFDGETYFLVYDGGEWLIDGEGEDDTEDGDGDVENDLVESESPTEPLASPSAIGDQVTLGDEWQIEVTEVEDDATATLTKPRYYNDDPRGQYVLVTFSATYLGADRTGSLGSLTWELTTSDAQVIDAASATTPAEAASWPDEARTGGTIEGQVAFDVPLGSASGGLLTVEAYDSDDNEVYVDFTL